MFQSSLKPAAAEVGTFWGKDRRSLVGKAREWKEWEITWIFTHGGWSCRDAIGNCLQYQWEREPTLSETFEIGLAARWSGIHVAGLQQVIMIQYDVSWDVPWHSISFHACEYWNDPISIHTPFGPFGLDLEKSRESKARRTVQELCQRQSAGRAFVSGSANSALAHPWKEAWPKLGTTA